MTLLADVEGLADRAQIKPLVLLRIDGQLLERPAPCPPRRSTPRAGFLQSYATQFAPIIALRPSCSCKVRGPPSSPAASSPRPPSISGPERPPPAKLPSTCSASRTAASSSPMSSPTRFRGSLPRAPSRVLTEPREEQEGIDVAGLLGTRAGPG